VLLSQVQGDVPPDWRSSQLANLVLRSFLGYSAVIPTFYELSRFDGQTRAFRVNCDTVGCNLRPSEEKGQERRKGSGTILRLSNKGPSRYNHALVPFGPQRDRRRTIAEGASAFVSGGTGHRQPVPEWIAMWVADQESCGRVPTSGWQDRR